MLIPPFKKVSDLPLDQNKQGFENNTIFILVPGFVLGIYPRAECETERFTEKQVQDFNKELLRTRDFVQEIPPPNHNRALDEVTRRLTSNDRRAFFYQGNELLVRFKTIHTTLT